MRTGIFSMSAEEYFAHHGVSQSQLKQVSRSPAYFKYAQDHPEPSTPDQIIGTIFDVAVFNPSSLETCCYVKPGTYDDGKGPKKWNGNSTFCREWTTARQDRPIISQSDFSNVLMMRDEVFKHPAAAMALKEGKGACLFCEDAETGLQLKAMPDFLSGNVILDLKSCQDSSPEGFARTVSQFSYELQAAFYLDVAFALGLRKEHFLFIATSKTPPFETAVYELDEESIAIGRSKYRRLLNRYLECVTVDKWPGYSKDVQFLSLPAWSKRNEQNALSLDDRPAQPAYRQEITGVFS